MKTIGVLVLVVGALAFLVGFNMDTTVAAGDYSLRRVHNIGLMNDRQNIIIFAGVLAVIGTLLFSLAGKNKQPSLISKESEPKDASPTQQARVGVFDGDRNILVPAYQLFLTRRFGIEKNSTLEKYVINNDVFDTLEGALGHADIQYGKELDRVKEKAELAFREVQEQTARLTQQQRAQAELLLERRRRCIENALNDPKQLNAFDDKGKTPLMHAIESRDTEAIKALIASGARTDQWGKDGDGKLLSIKEMAKKSGVSL